MIKSWGLHDTAALEVHTEDTMSEPLFVFVDRLGAHIVDPSHVGSVVEEHAVNRAEAVRVKTQIAGYLTGESE